MSNKLLATNPYLRDPVQRERSVLKSVVTSSAIEGIRAPFRDMAAATVQGVKTVKSGASRAKR